MTMWRVVRHIRKSQKSERHNISAQPKTEVGAGKMITFSTRYPPPANSVSVGVVGSNLFNAPEVFNFGVSHCPLVAARYEEVLQELERPGEIRNSLSHM